MTAPQRSSANIGPASSRVLVHPNLWLALVALGFGFTTWAAFLYMGLRARHRTWLAWSAAYGALLVISGVLDMAPHPSSAAASVAAIALLGAWLGGTAHAGAVRKEAWRRIRRSNTVALDTARQRIERRSEGRRLADRDLRLAKEIGVGRPDIPGAEDFGLIDVNHVSQETLLRLPGITPEIAHLIKENRQEVGFFKSADELTVCLNLPPGLVDEIREYAIFL